MSSTLTLPVNIFTWKNLGETMGAIHSTKIPTGPTGKSGPPQKVDPFFRNFSGWTEPIHSVLDRNFRKFWLNGSRPRSHRRTGVSLLNMETERDKNNRILPPASLRSQKLKKLVCYTKSKKEGQDNKKRGRC